MDVIHYPDGSNLIKIQSLINNNLALSILKFNISKMSFTSKNLQSKKGGMSFIK